MNDRIFALLDLAILLFCVLMAATLALIFKWVRRGAKSLRNMERVWCDGKEVGQDERE